MKRKLFFLERMIYGKGDTAFNAVVPVKIKGTIPVGNLTHALQRIQEKHPFLKAFIERDKKKMPWFVVNEDEANPIPVRIVPRFSDNDWLTEVTREWSTVFDMDKGPLMRVVWIRGTVCSELILVMHHCVCDGRSAMSVLEDLLLLLEDGDAQIGKEIPILSVSDIIPSEVLGDTRKKLKAKLSGKLTSLVLWLMPLRKRLTERKRDYMINWKLDQKLSDHLLKVSKRSGATINTLLCKAVLTAFKEIRGNKEFHNKIVCPVDIRKYIPQIKEENIFAFVTMVIISASDEPDFIVDAKRMQEDITKKTAELKPYEMIMQMEESHSSLENLSDFLKYSKPANDCLFSNLGKISIRHQYENFELETIYSPSAVGPLGKTTGFVASTFRGQMDLTFIGSEGFLPYEEALAIKDRIEKIIEAIHYGPLSN
ncbi:condensation domain-containing protein [Pedobacter sp. MC2016-15]|uniref:condensation domain-containing protein n=1 Tax=Pedobacter sp. MC2016-15 TaxID=2994473 RepID=UPI002247B085|nr:condensation domain-containing protein [Pedobacter sp. MC2016-15]MCX2479474.1 condensation domain-containing protein [Pedobacter sp. MC2016-15]